MTGKVEEGSAYVSGVYLPLREAAVPILDWGFLRGDCVYDAIPFTQGLLFRLPDHLQRFWQSMATWRLRCPHEQEEVRRICHRLVAKSGLRDGLLLIITTRGLPPSLEVRNPALFENRFYAFAQVLPKIANAEQLRRGLHIVVAKTPRIPERSIDPTAKNFQWGDFTQARLQAHEAGADNSLLLDYAGNLSEGPGFNVFIVKEGRLSTPAHNCLRGVTRATVLEVAAAQGLPCDERDIPADELFNADEAFFSSSAGGLFPVTRVNGQPIGNGVAGTVTQALLKEYWRRRADPARCEAVDYGQAPASGPATDSR